jgi:hypothetical protein
MSDRVIDTVQEWLYVVVAAALALYLVIGVVAWTWMLLDGIDVPSGFTTVLATIAGGMIGALGPLRPPARGRG